MVYRDERNQTLPQLPPPPRKPFMPGLPPMDHAPEDATPMSSDLVGDIPPPPMAPGHDKAPKMVQPTIEPLMPPAPVPDAMPPAAPMMSLVPPQAPPLASAGVPITGAAPSPGGSGPDDLGELFRRLAAGGR